MLLLWAPCLVPLHLANLLRVLCPPRVYHVLHFRQHSRILVHERD